MKVVALYSIKGGVGKTTAAVNLAYLASREGWRTLLWDLDPQGAATFLFRVRAKVRGGAKGLVRRTTSVRDAVKETDFPGLDLLPADFSNRDLDLLLDDTQHPLRRFERVLRPVQPSYDVTVLDCGPSISLVSEAVIRVADVMVVPIVPAPLALRTYEQLRGFVGETSRGGRPTLLPFFSMTDSRRRLHRDALEAWSHSHDGAPPVSIPATSLAEQMAVRRAPLPAFAPRVRAARSYEELWAATGAALGIAASA